MSLVAVFRKDFRDSSRSQLLWATIAVFVILAALFTAGYVEYFVPNIPEATTEVVTFGLVGLLSGQLLGGIAPIPIVVPLIGLLLGHKAIVGEREGGQLKFLLGLPHSRSEVVAGKMLGRSSVALIAIAAGFAIAGLMVLVTEGLVFGPFLALLVVTALYALAYVSIGIGISAAVSSSGIATALIVLVYVVFQFLWNVTFLAVEGLILRPRLAGSEWSPPAWFRFLKSLNPVNAFNGALNTIIKAFGTVPEAFEGQIAAGAGGSVPFYLADWFGFVLLALWIAVPLGLGYWTFDRADLG